MKSKLTNTDWASKHVLSLPIHPNVSTKNIEYIAKTVRDLVHE
nr:DegT/DnrJ/EryC1/StrS family aminotransferase [Nitrosopumilus piranensis]